MDDNSYEQRNNHIIMTYSVKYFKFAENDDVSLVCFYGHNMAEIEGKLQ